MDITSADAELAVEALLGCGGGIDGSRHALANSVLQRLQEVPGHGARVGLEVSSQGCRT